MISQHKLII